MANDRKEASAMSKGCSMVAASVVACAAAFMFPSAAHAQQGPMVQAQQDLFYNFYENGSWQGGIPVKMYPAPLPVPAYTGETYITYQPMMPHEFLYPHCRTYRRTRLGIIPVNTTHVMWYRGPNWWFKGLGGSQFATGY
ncbi:MAG TPA: hypothetical protein VHZ24_13810 [Pirellulales bacterium]|nr:hypothetical protein [Pirellulales bacterium]